MGEDGTTKLMVGLVVVVGVGAGVVGTGLTMVVVVVVVPPPEVLPPPGGVFPPACAITGHTFMQ